MYNPATCDKKFKMWPLANTVIVGRYACLFCLFGLILNVHVNSYGHVRTVSSPNQTNFFS